MALRGEGTEEKESDAARRARRVAMSRCPAGG
ncbi:MAG: hypothetical protein QOG35_1567, partial [Solirubrobacteraceae bacterium]|nr:hypothetical protein [Solirubrobacteraceae bacterium]